MEIICSKHIKIMFFQKEPMSHFKIPKKCTHNSHKKHIIPNYNKLIKNLLTHKISFIPYTSTRRCLKFQRLGRKARTYYHDHHYIPPWINFNKLMPLDEVAHRVLNSYSNNNSQCIKLSQLLLFPLYNTDPIPNVKPEDLNQEDYKKVNWTPKSKAKFIKKHQILSIDDAVFLWHAEF